MTERPLNFTSDAERTAWITDYADYFTVIQRINQRYERQEFKTLKEAEAAANTMLKDHPNARFMIYAVAGVSDTFIKTIERKDT